VSWVTRRRCGAAPRRETGPEEFDDYRYLVRLLFRIDHRYDDKSDMPSQLFRGAGL
jgi:hypothetical protein